MIRTKKPKSNKKQIGVKIDEILWRKFRSKCLENGITAGAKIEEFIEKYLKSVKK